MDYNCISTPSKVLNYPRLIWQFSYYRLYTDKLMMALTNPRSTFLHRIHMNMCLSLAQEKGECDISQWGRCAWHSRRGCPTSRFFQMVGYLPYGPHKMGTCKCCPSKRSSSVVHPLLMLYFRSKFTLKQKLSGITWNDALLLNLYLMLTL